MDLQAREPADAANAAAAPPRPPGLRERSFDIAGKRVRVVLGEHIEAEMAAALAELDADRFVVVTDARVAELAAGALAERLERTTPTLLLSHPPGEEFKNLATLSRFVDLALDFGVTRRSVVVAVGGGIPGNIAGVLAGLLFRGLRLVHVPTTVIAACDSVLSVKQAVNTGHAKNTVGLYHIPEAVLVDLAVVAGGSPRDLRSGTCETVKNALAIEPAQIPRLRRLLRREADYSPADLGEIFELSLAVKGRLLLEDPYEKHAGVLLEYGHTVGHALELAGAGRGPGGGDMIKHGEAVALGMTAAADVAHRAGLLDAEGLAVHEELIDRVGVCRCLTVGIAPETVLHHIAYDNKRGYRSCDGSEVAMVLLRAVGAPLNAEQRYLTPVPHTLVAAAVHDLLRRGKECTAGHGPS
ncbi:iron-containing alcohol dehydrogenase [Streptomyces sp. LP05-1]|uniref:2-deoxy-scyllo-inosose synthase n=1 Tax=Streptomyces pyxinae TaxID=2970734 RepID=A0ABT2CC23_9ACTN|nr:iron-containing alcohol dehydrogenase [Streptomyces sp. LP05-1]MCS0634962.1 iron-containing alcohol dehydrogenase [Streptomyces sp. LP05-1]